MSRRDEDRGHERTRSLLSTIPPSSHLHTSYLQHTHSTFTYIMVNLINMAFLTTNELHNVADRMDPIIKSVNNGLAVRAEQADALTDEEDVENIEQPLPNDMFMAPLLNDEMENELYDYGPRSNPTSSASSSSSDQDQDHVSGSGMVDDNVEPMPQQLPNWGFMLCIMQYVYIEAGMFGFVFHTLVSLGWTDRGRYPSPLDFVTRLNV